MEFDKQYFDARDQAFKWLSKDYHQRNFKDGIFLLSQMRFKPLLCTRLKMHGDTPIARRNLVTAIRDAANFYKAENLSKYDIIPAELINEESVPKMPVKVEAERLKNDTEKFSSYPESIRILLKRYADSYKERAIMHRSLMSVGEENDPESCKKRKDISDNIESLTKYMDALYLLRERFEKEHIVPTIEEINGIEQVKAETPKKNEPVRDVSKSSFRIKDENFEDMTLDALKKRRHTIKSALVKKQNLLQYQVEKKLDKPHLMPDCPLRIKLEKQVEILTEKMYQADKALAKFG